MATRSASFRQSPGVERVFEVQGFVSRFLPMAAKKQSKSPGKFAKPQSRRVWLTYPTKLIKRPLIWELGHKFALVTNVRQASVSDEVGILCLEVEGAPS